MPTEIPAGRSWPTQWRYDQLSAWQSGDPLPSGWVFDRVRGTNQRANPSDDYGQRALGRGIEQRTSTSLIRVYVEFEADPLNWPEDDLPRYPSKYTVDPSGNAYDVQYASRYMNRQSLMNDLLTGRARPLARILEERIWGPAGRGRIQRLIAVHIADGPGRN